MNYSHHMLFKEFRHHYPQLWRRGTHYELCGNTSIRVRIPTVGVLVYEYIGHHITWEKRWEDPVITKENTKEERFDMYQRFLSEIDIFQKETGATQATIAELTGISRKSVNRYLSGAAMPKTATMQSMAEKLGIDI